MSKLIHNLDAGATPLENLLNLIAAIAIFILMALGIVQIGLRSIFNFPIVGYIDLVELSMASMAFLGAAYCQRLVGEFLAPGVGLFLVLSRSFFGSMSQFLTSPVSLGRERERAPLKGSHSSAKERLASPFPMKKRKRKTQNRA